MIYFDGETHEKRFVSTILNNPYKLPREQLAAFYLLSADNKLWKAVRQFAKKDRIDFALVDIHSGSPRAYLLGKIAQDLCGDTSHITLKDLCDWELVNPKTFKLIIAALAGLFTSRTEHHPLPKAEVSEETLCGYRRFVEERFKTEPEALSVTRICELTSMVGMTVHRLIANGILYGTKVQGKTFCSKSTLIDYLASEDTFRNPTCEGCKELVRTFKRRKSDDTYNEQRRERRKREREKKG